MKRGKFYKTKLYKVMQKKHNKIMTTKKIYAIAVHLFCL